MVSNFASTAASTIVSVATNPETQTLVATAAVDIGAGAAIAVTGGAILAMPAGGAMLGAAVSATSYEATTLLTRGQTNLESWAIQELTAGAEKVEGESAVLSKISEMSEHDRDMAKRIHAIIKASAPSLSPRLWYGMPICCKKDKAICFFQSAGKFKARYATLGFSDKAKLDEGDMWPTSYALKGLTAPEVARIVALVKKAIA